MKGTKKQTQLLTSNIRELLFIATSVVWFVIVALITVHTEYQLIIADKLADPQGTSTQLESILRFLIPVLSFMPASLLLVYHYVLRAYKTHRALRIVMFSLIISIALFVPFSWYNFIVNFVK